MIRLYTASKISRTFIWQQLRTEYVGKIEFTSRWLDMCDLEATATRKDFRRFWLIDKADVERSDYLMIWGENEEHLRGALVEAGIAIANGIPVLTIGRHPDYGSWQHHPLVSNFPTVYDAFNHLLGD